MTDSDQWTVSYHNLFPTALFVFSLKEHDKLNQQLLALIYRLKQSDPGQTASNVLGWHSKVNLFELSEIQPFKQLVDGAIAQVAQAVGYGNVRIVAANCWANVNPKYASNKIHDHANSLFSGVYYVKTPKDCGNLMFYDPRSARTFYKPNVQGYTAYTADAVAHVAEAGLLLIFPSWLKHGVEPNLSDEDRISISFNYVFA
ncbi:TIGR02466 family protein [Leptothermofonsia sp. ETS-13]|uniref:TIGR02466 family protein n=1 Tax=Leptothermofonsia sp. ETS-13 TaxID=3035696 RepID=UPI003BA353FE